MKMLLGKLCSLSLFVVLVGFSFTACGSDGNDENSVESSNMFQTSGSIDGHEYTDLGLSVSWATVNMEATNIEEEGNDYFWADPSGHLTFAEASSYGFPKNPIKSSSYDIATVKWGPNWGLPSFQEVEELSAKCTFVKCTLKGKEGLKVVGPNGKYIFLPKVTTRYSYSIKPPFEEHDISEYGYMYAGERLQDNKTGKITISTGFNIMLIGENVSFGYTNGTHSRTYAVRAVTKKGATGFLSNTSGNENNGQKPDGGTFTSYEKPDLGLVDYTCYTTSITVKYRIFNQDKAKVTSAKGYYGTSSASKSVTASVAGSLITVRITGLKKGTTYYVKCSATGKGGTTTSESTKLITNF